MAGEITQYQSGHILIPVQHPSIGMVPIQTEKRKWEWQEPAFGPYFYIQEEQLVTVLQNRQHLLVGDLEVDGEILIKGELVLI